MKNIFKTMTFLLLLAELTGSCQKEISPNCEGENTQQVESFYMDEFENKPCGLQHIEGSEKETQLIITTEEDFEKYFTCSEQMDIDFNEYFILAGMYRHHQCALFDSQQVSICNNKIIYKVRMLEQICQAPTAVFYSTVIEKKHNALPVEFDVQFKN